MYTSFKQYILENQESLQRDFGDLTLVAMQWMKEVDESAYDRGYTEGWTEWYDSVKDDSNDWLGEDQ